MTTNDTAALVRQMREAMQPFVARNSSEHSIRLDVKTVDVALARTALAAADAWLAKPPTNQCGEVCERAKLCATCARELGSTDAGLAVSGMETPTTDSGWQPIETAPEGVRVLLGPRSAPVVGIVKHYPDDTSVGTDSLCSVVHYNGEVLVAGYRCSEWSPLPAG